MKSGQHPEYSLHTMKDMKQSPANQTQLVRVQAAFEALLAEVLQGGFHGRGRLELSVADGTIQWHSRTVEQIDKRR